VSLKKSKHISKTRPYQRVFLVKALKNQKLS